MLCIVLHLRFVHSFIQNHNVWNRCKRKVKWLYFNSYYFLCSMMYVWADLLKNNKLHSKEFMYENKIISETFLFLSCSLYRSRMVNIHFSSLKSITLGWTSVVVDTTIAESWYYFHGRFKACKLNFVLLNCWCIMQCAFTENFMKN